MFTLENLEEKINNIKTEVNKKEQEIINLNAKMAVYLEMIEEIKSQKKAVTDGDIYNAARIVIASNQKMQRVNSIVTYLREQDFDIPQEEANTLKYKLLESRKFRINQDTKFWEIVE